MDLVLMGNRDARRLGLIQAALQGRISNREGAEALAISVRQFKRLRSRFRTHGARGLVHGNRGRPSPRRLAEATRQRVHELLTGAVNHLSVFEVVYRPWTDNAGRVPRGSSIGLAPT